MCEDSWGDKGFIKGHNPRSNTIKFGCEISFEEFKRFVLKEPISKLTSIEIQEAERKYSDIYQKLAIDLGDDISSYSPSVYLRDVGSSLVKSKLDVPLITRKL